MSARGRPKESPSAPLWSSYASSIAGRQPLVVAVDRERRFAGRPATAFDAEEKTWLVKVSQIRDKLRERHWPNEIPWRGAGDPTKEKGWFSAPRTLPLLLSVMKDKGINRSKGDIGRAYVELLSRQRGQGVVEMEAPAVHAYACGFRGARGERTWTELMSVLEKAGFIKTKSGNGRRYDTVLIVHPAVVVKRLGDRIPEDLLNTYHNRQVAGGERAYEDLVGPAETKAQPATVLPMKQRPKR